MEYLEEDSQDILPAKLSLRDCREKILAFIQKWNYEVGYWSGEELVCYQRQLPETKDSSETRPPRSWQEAEELDNLFGSLHPFSQPENAEGSELDLDWNDLHDALEILPNPLTVARTPSLKEQWKKEWAETGKGPGMVPFVLNAVNPETGKKDGIQYTFGNSHVAQALACYAHAEGKLGAVKNLLATYEDGLQTLRDIPEHRKGRNTLFRVWKAHWEPQFQGLLTGKGQTYLMNMVSTKYRMYLRDESPSE